jgi:hypothetical protein
MGQVYALGEKTNIDLQLIYSPLPYANSIRDKFLAAIANDLERKDWITIYEITRMLAGLKK